MELSYVKIKSAQYMARLLKKKIYAARHSQFYEFIEWVGVRPKDLLKHIIKTLHEEFPDDTEAIEALEEAYKWPSRRISREFNEITYDFPSIHSIIRDYVLKECEKIALVFGTEGDGLTTPTLACCDYKVRIPMQHGVDSLNVAASSAVAFWELRRKPL